MIIKFIQTFSYEKKINNNSRIIRTKKFYERLNPNKIFH